MGDYAGLRVLDTGWASFRADRRSRTVPVLQSGVFGPLLSASQLLGPQSPYDVLLLQCCLWRLCPMVLLCGLRHTEVWRRLVGGVRFHLSYLTVVLSPH